MRVISQIILHCSDSEFGDAKYLNGVATKKGFAGKDGILGTDDDISYHFAILNGKRAKRQPYISSDDGKIETGRPIQDIGAHCKNENHDSIGICLIGVKDFTDNQFESLRALIERLWDRFGILPVYGHYEMPSGIDQGKTCPNFDVQKFRNSLRSR